MTLPDKDKGRRYCGVWTRSSSGLVYDSFRGGTARGLHALLTDPETLWVATLWENFVKAS